MLERISSEAIFNELENLQRQKPVVLELGTGYEPAPFIGQPEFFQNDGVTFIGLDLLAQQRQNHAINRRHAELNPVAANMHAIPLRDESVDIVLMKSIFGQFTERGDSSYLDVSEHAMLEIGRVLKPGAFAFIFEENTPWDDEDIEFNAVKAGLEKVVTIGKIATNAEEGVNPDWKHLRSMFYDQSTDTYGSTDDWDDWFDEVCCVVVRKPKDALIQVTTREVLINSHEIAAYDNDWFCNNKLYPQEVFRELIFKAIKKQ